MSPPSTPRRKSATRIILLVLGIFFVANFIAVIACWLQPKLYESSGAIREWAPPNKSTPLAGAHAAMIVSAKSLHLRWDIPFDDAVQQLREGITVETTASETAIRAQFSSASDSRMLAEAVMRDFPGFERERQWAQIEDLDGRYTKREEDTRRQIEQLRKSIFTTLRESGHYIPGSLVSPETAKRLENEDLRRQFKAYQKLNVPLGRFSPPDGNILIPPLVASEPYEVTSPISPNPDTYFLAGRIAGLICSITALLLAFRYRPSLIESPPRKPGSNPAWAAAKENSASNRPSW